MPTGMDRAVPHEGHEAPRTKKSTGCLNTVIGHR